jgi:hypothetical protein
VNETVDASASVCGSVGEVGCASVIVSRKVSSWELKKRGRSCCMAVGLGTSRRSNGRGDALFYF